MVDPPSLFDAFDTIRIINLPHRTDRRAEMEGELAAVGLAGDPRVRFFDAIAPADAGTFTSRGARGCFESHLAILDAAAAIGGSVLILEDDCDFSRAAPDFRLPGDWQIFYGGYDATTPENLQTSNIHGTHFIAFNADAVRQLVVYLREILGRADHPPIDGAYVWFRRAHPDVKTVFAEPKLGHQRPSRTDIADLRFFDRLPLLREVASLARRFKRRLGR